MRARPTHHTPHTTHHTPHTTHHTPHTTRARPMHTAQQRTHLEQRARRSGVEVCCGAQGRSQRPQRGRAQRRQRLAGREGGLQDSRDHSTRAPLVSWSSMLRGARAHRPPRAGLPVPLRFEGTAVRKHNTDLQDDVARQVQPHRHPPVRRRAPRLLRLARRLGLEAGALVLRPRLYSAVNGCPPACLEPCGAGTRAVVPHCADTVRVHPADASMPSWARPAAPPSP
jgi:hypothetical protein